MTRLRKDGQPWGKPGPKGRTETRTPETYLMVLLTPREKAHLEATAARLDLPMAEVARRALRAAGHLPPEGPGTP